MVKRSLAALPCTQKSARNQGLPKEIDETLKGEHSIWQLRIIYCESLLLFSYAMEDLCIFSLDYNKTYHSSYIEIRKLLLYICICDFHILFAKHEHSSGILRES